MTSISLEHLLEHSFTGIWNFYWNTLHFLLEYFKFYTWIFKKCVGLGLPDFWTFYQRILAGFIGS